jgi:GT2 family glycosyltransferase
MRGGMASASDITAIIVSFNSAAVLAGCVAALASEGVRALVVDNASADDSVAVAERAGAGVIRAPRNEGYGRGNNLGLRAATTRYVLVCNPDLTVGAGAIAALLAAAERFPDAGLWAPLVVEPSGRRFVQPRSLLSPAHLNAAREVLVPDGPASIPFVSGACFLAERETLLALGGFDPEIFLFYEDDDLCRRLMDAGRAPLIAPAAVVTHLRGRSSTPTRASRYKVRWHSAWSEGYVRGKYGLPRASLTKLLWSATRAALNAVVLRFDDVARYGGSAAGALAHLRGRRALEREGLT